MKKSMKNRVAGAAAVLLAGSMAFSMTGCGSSSDNTAGQQTATDQKTEGNEEYTKIVYAFKSFNNIPEDLSVIGYNNSMLTTCCTPELTSVDNRLETQTHQLVQTLLGVLSGEEMPKKSIFSGKLIKRGTTLF